MSDEPKNLETKAWYRILKVLYGLGWIIVFLITGFAFLILKPSSFVDLNKSSFYCPEKMTAYSLGNTTGLYSRGDKYLNMEDHIFATRACGMDMVNFSREEAKAAKIPDKYVDEHLANLFDQNSEDFKKSFNIIESMRKNPKYQINFVYHDTGMNWFKSLAGVGITFVIAMFLLKLVRDVVLYIATGKQLGSKEYEVKRAKELIRSSEVDESEEEIKVEQHRIYKKTDSNAPGCLVVILLTIGGFIGIFAIGAIASALSNKSGNTQTYPTYQNYDNGSTSNTTPQKQIDYQSVKGYAFPEINQSAFKQSCIKEAGSAAAGISQAYCSCLLNYSETNYSFKEFLNIEQEYLKTKKFPPDLVSAMANCVK